MTESANLSDWITTKQAAELTGYEPAHIRDPAQKESIQASEAAGGRGAKKLTRGRVFDKNPASLQRPNLGGLNTCK